MNRVFSLLISVLLLTSCGNDQLILPQSVGSFGKILVVTDNSKWQGDLGKEIRKTFGRLQAELPQPEKLRNLTLRRQTRAKFKISVPYFKKLA